MTISFINLASINHPSLKQSDINLSPISDPGFKGKSYHYEVGTLSFVLALICKMSDGKCFASLDEGFLSAESCFGEEEASEVIDALKKAKEIVLDSLIRLDVNYQAIAFFLNFLKTKYDLSLNCLDGKEIKADENFELLPLKDYNGLLLYHADFGDERLHCSAQFAQIARLKDKDECLVSTKNLEFKTKLDVDTSFKGTVGFCKLANENFEKIRAIKCL